VAPYLGGRFARDIYNYDHPIQQRVSILGWLFSLFRRP
jgi:hypothetical protein